jgi:hypothetical protein
MRCVRHIFFTQEIRESGRVALPKLPQDRELVGEVLVDRRDRHVAQYPVIPSGIRPSV